MSTIEIISTVYGIEGLVAGIWFLKGVRIAPDLHRRVIRLAGIVGSYRVAIVILFVLTIIGWPVAVTMIETNDVTRTRNTT